MPLTMKITPKNPISPHRTCRPADAVGEEVSRRHRSGPWKIAPCSAWYRAVDLVTTKGNSSMRRAERLNAALLSSVT